ncbi:MAG: hypothetical protein AAGI24_01480 [Pseudomonadota bacterium]
MAFVANRLAQPVMGCFRVMRDHTRMANYLFQNHRGSILVNVEGSVFLLDTGTPFSVADNPIPIAGVTFPAETCYLGIDGVTLSEQLNTPVDGLIGTDILRHFNLAVYAGEGMVQFSQLPASGEIVVPIAECAGMPVVALRVGGRVCRMFLDTGSGLSLLLPELLSGTESVGNTNAWYPLVGNYRTPFYRLETIFGDRNQSMLFGVAPEVLRPVMETANVHGMLGTELLKFYGLNLSLRDRVIRLEAQSGNQHFETA